MGKNLNFEAQHTTLRGLLVSHRTLRVPRYQRPYAWSDEQIVTFWEDLSTSEEPYFFGNIILCGESFESPCLDIIDGQQRLLTVSLFLAVLRDIEKKYDELMAGVWQRHDLATEDVNGNLTWLVLAADSIRPYFEKYVQGSFTTGEDIRSSVAVTAEQKKVKANYEALREYVETRLEMEPDALAYLEKLRDRVMGLGVIRVLVYEEDDAYDIFEMTNARGVDLSVADLLKNMIFKKLPTSETAEGAKTAWDELTRNVEGSGGEMRRFIRYFWISRESFVMERKLYKEYKKTRDWDELLKSLLQDSYIYQLLISGTKEDFRDPSFGFKHPERIYRAVNSLRLMNVTQCFVYIMAILRNYKMLGYDPAEIFEFIEKFSFQYSAICQLPGNRVERLYSRHATALHKRVAEMYRDEKLRKKIPGEVSRLFAKFQTELLENAPGRAQFMESFARIQYSRSPSSRMMIKYIFSQMEYFLTQNREKVIDFDVVNIEHILPQKPKKWGLSQAQVKGYVNLIGNLTLVDMDSNSTMQNGTIDQKLPELDKSHLAVTAEVIKRVSKLGNGWTQADIEQRSADLAQWAVDGVWKLN